MGKGVSDAVESCSIEEVLARLMVRPRASHRGSITGSVMLSSGSLQKSEDVVGDMGGDSTVSKLHWEDSLLCGALQLAGDPTQTLQQHAMGVPVHSMGSRQGSLLKWEPAAGEIGVTTQC